MASSSAHDFFLQEANTISYVHLLMSRAWRHLDVTHVPLVNQVRDLFFIKSQKMIFFTLQLCVFLDFWDARGLGLLFMVCACAVGLRGNRLTGMRGTWGVVWRSAHVPTIPFTWLRRANAWAPTAKRPITMWKNVDLTLVCVCSLSHGVTWTTMPICGQLWRQWAHMG